MKIWEIVTKAGSTSIEHIMSLKDHKRGIPSLCFTASSSQILTVSLDNHVRYYNLAVRWQVREDPKLIWQRDISEDIKTAGAGAAVEIIAVSKKEEKEGAIFVISAGRSFYVYDLKSGKLMETVVDAHPKRIAGLSFSGDSRRLLTHSDGGKSLMIWNLPPAMSATASAMGSRS